MATDAPRKRRPVVAVMTGSFHTDYSGLVVNSICTALEDHDVDICLLQGLDASRFLKVDNYVDTGFDDHYYSQFEYCKFLQPDLMVISFGTISGIPNPVPLEEFLSALPKVPVILLEVETQLPNCMCISVDNYGGMKDCVDHLIEQHGCRSILYLSGPRDVPDSQLRCQAYLDSMAQHGLTVTDSMVAYGDFTDRVFPQLEGLLKECPHPDAIVCANDEMAESAYTALRRHGLEPGRDVAVTGFDDALPLHSPSLTTVKQDLQAVGKVLSQSVRSVLDGQMPPSVRIPAKMVIRESCGCTEQQQTVRKGPHSPHHSDIVHYHTQIKRLKRDNMLTALMLRSLLQEKVSPPVFFQTLGKLLHSLGTPRSSIALLPERLCVKGRGRMFLPDQLKLVMSQTGERVNAYDFAAAPLLCCDTSALEVEQAGRKGLCALFPLFYSSTHYGAFWAELAPEDMLFYYTLSLEIATGLRYLFLAMDRQAAQSALEEKNEILNFSASHDALTGLYNRAGLMNQFFEHLRTHGVGQSYVLFMADLDHLKQINDTFGHSAGDEAIRTAADLLRLSLPPGSPLGRTGGDEFAGLFLLREDYTAREFEQKLGALLEQYNADNDKPWYEGVSVGCAPFTFEQVSQVTEQLKVADAQLYCAKTRRRKNVVRHPPKIQK